MAINIYGVNQVSELLPHLYLTSIYGATKENITRRNITLLVNAAQELPKCDINGVESIKLFLDDTPNSLASVYFDRIADKINDHAASGGRAFIHCVLGVSRSTTLCIAYLMKYKSMTLKQAFDYIAVRRPCARPNPGFWRQLVEYEKRLNSMKLKMSYNAALNNANVNTTTSNNNNHNNNNQMSTTAAAAAATNNTTMPSLNLQTPMFFGNNKDMTVKAAAVGSSSSSATHAANNHNGMNFDDTFFASRLTPSSKLYKNINRIGVPHQHGVGAGTSNIKQTANNKNETVISSMTIRPSFPTTISSSSSGFRGGLLINNNSQDLILQQKPAVINSTYRTSFGIPRF